MESALRQFDHAWRNDRNRTRRILEFCLRSLRMPDSRCQFIVSSNNKMLTTTNLEDECFIEDGIQRFPVDFCFELFLLIR